MSARDECYVGVRLSKVGQPLEGYLDGINIIHIYVRRRRLRYYNEEYKLQQWYTFFFSSSLCRLITQRLAASASSRSLPSPSFSLTRSLSVRLRLSVSLFFYFSRPFFRRARIVSRAPTRRPVTTKKKSLLPVCPRRRLCTPTRANRLGPRRTATLRNARSSSCVTFAPPPPVIISPPPAPRRRRA